MMIFDIIIVGAILAACVSVSIAAIKKFQPEIEKELQKHQQYDSIDIKLRK